MQSVLFLLWRASVLNGVLFLTDAVKISLFLACLTIYLFICLSIPPLDQPYWVHSFQELHPSGCEARQLPYGPWQKGQPSIHHWFWFGQEVPRRPDPPAHPLSGKQESDWHSPLRLYQHPPGNRWACRCLSVGLSRGGCMSPEGGGWVLCLTLLLTCLEMVGK